MVLNYKQSPYAESKVSGSVGRDHRKELKVAFEEIREAEKARINENLQITEIEAELHRPSPSPQRFQVQ